MKKGVSLLTLTILASTVLFSGCVGQNQDNEITESGESVQLEANTEKANIKISASAVIGGEIYNREELKQHNNAESCWVAKDDRVYDITEFLKQHKAPLEKYCGTKEEYEQAYTKKHDDSKDDILAGFEIGDFQE